MKLIYISVILLTGYGLSSAQVNRKIKLNGDDWKLASADGGYFDIAATVPGSVHTDLLKNGSIQDPLYRDNDVKYRWVATQDWVYAKNFTVTKMLLMLPNINLKIGGIDTISTIKINDVVVGKTDNMFRRYVFPIAAKLKEGENTISVTISSPVNYAADAAKSYPYDVPPDCPPEAQHGECHFNFIRKEACSFSWDWGPSFPTLGIWRNLTIEGYRTATIRYITVKTTPDNNNPGAAKVWSLSGSVYMDVDDDIVAQEAQIALYMEGHTNAVIDVVLQAGRDKYDFHIHNLNSSNTLDLWMPNGFGRQTLYALEVTVRLHVEDMMFLIDRRTIKVGFRTVELIQEPIEGSEGLSFYFTVNGWPVFMKGSNWIPADSFQENITSSYLRKLLTSAKEANMNMLRVWGGGVYESEEFYSLCDELGIMIWQDFMFACALYPTDERFLHNVQEEVRHQVRRLYRHPSIAIWAGNNENEAAMRDNWYHITDFDRYYKDYVKLYIENIREIVEQEDTSRPFVSSSPSNGKDSEKEGWIAKDPYSEIYGDVHVYNYAVDSWNWTVNPKPRFASEFGLQSWCSYETLSKVATEEDLVLDSDFVNHRQHHTDGNDQMKKEWMMHFDPPLMHPLQAQNEFSHFIYLTQINQAMGIKTEAELYRRLQGRLMDGKGHTMGSLYWQLNDIWQAPTWASIEYGGKWKMLHYFAKKFYNSTFISPAIEESGVVRLYMVDDLRALPLPESHGHVVDKSHDQKRKSHDQVGKSHDGGDNGHLNGVGDNVLRFKPYGDEMSAKNGFRHLQRRSVKSPSNVGYPFVNVTLKVYLHSWASLTPVKTWTKTFAKPETPSEIVFEEKITDLMSGTSCNASHCFLYFESWPAFAKDELSTNFLLFSYFKDVLNKGLRHPPSLRSQAVQQINSQTFKIPLTTNDVAPFVWLDVEGVVGRFSDNGFLMREPKKDVYFYTWEDTSLSEVTKGLKLMSLMDLYQVP